MKSLLDESGNPTGESKELARIHWHYFGSSRLIYEGKILELNSFMPYSVLLRSIRRFTGPDGRQYKWNLGFFTSQLELEEVSGSSTVVAKMRQRNVIHGTKPALEIEPDVMPILDLVVVTWVFAEQRRRDIENKYPSSR